MLRVNYKGCDADYEYRIAEIAFDENELERVERIADMMNSKGWDIDIVTDGFALCRVDDKNQYKAFMEDWKKCKRLS